MIFDPSAAGTPSGDLSRKALTDFFLGKKVHIVMDRPIGAEHPKHPGLIYPINYGYLPGVISGDGEELDVYLLGVDVPVKECDAVVIGVIHRTDDVEDKLVAAPEGKKFFQHEIAQAVFFQERFHRGYVESVCEKSCGTVIFTVDGGVRKYLLIRSRNGVCGFPKGHMEPGEDERGTALRETWEETSVRAEIVEGFRAETVYTMPNGKEKTVVYFLAGYSGGEPKHNPGFEDNEYLVLPYGEAYEALTHQNNKKILEQADRFQR